MNTTTHFLSVSVLVSVSGSVNTPHFLRNINFSVNFVALRELGMTIYYISNWIGLLEVLQCPLCNVIFNLPNNNVTE